MISADDLFNHAQAMFTQAGAANDEALMRRAISTTYYGLFHLLTREGAGLVAGGIDLTAAKVARTFEHGSMKKVCTAYSQSSGTLPAWFKALVAGPPNARLISVANAFVDLQTRRHVADYDLSATIDWPEAGRLLVLGLKARHDFNAIRDQPETRTFLVALLLADRWSRGG